MILVNQIYKCQYCNKKYTKRYLLVRHLKSKHKNKMKIIKYKCKNCNKEMEYLKWDKMITNKKTYCSRKCYKEYVGNIKRKIKNTIWKCDKCGKVLSSKYSLQRHMNLKNCNKYTCQKCEKEFNSITEYNHHCEINDCINNNYICEFCKRQFKNRNGLTLHLKLKHKDKIKINYIECKNDNCHKKIKELSIGNYIQPNRKFCSDKCLFKYQSKIQYKEKKYNCHICNESFSSKKLLNKHIKIRHLNKQYKCKYCEATYNSITKLHQHYNENHNDKKIKIEQKCENPDCNKILAHYKIANYEINKQRFCNRNCAGTYSGYKTAEKYTMPKEVREKIANSGNGTCKWFDYVDQYGNEHRLQGSYEYKFAQKLDELNIKFKSHPHGIKYEINNKKTFYFPDFYIPSKNLYVDTKSNYYLKLQDLEKFNKVREQNSNINLVILTEKYLEAFGIKL